MIRIDPFSSASISEQLKAGLRGLVAKGALRSGDPAPSARALAAELKVHPQAVARALRELAVEGLLDMRQGELRISETVLFYAVDGAMQARDAVVEAVRRARLLGLSWDELEECLRRIREEEEPDEP